MPDQIGPVLAVGSCRRSDASRRDRFESELQASPDPAPERRREGEPDAQQDSHESRDPKPSKTASALAGTHVLVVASRDDEPAQLGLPVDRVIGLVDGSRHGRGAGKLVVERRPVEGRLVSVLDPRRLVERATDVIERVT